MSFSERLLNILIALDQFLFCLVTLGSASPDETLSAAAYRWEQQGRWNGFLRKLIDRLFWFDPNHCHNAYLSELRGLQLPPTYKKGG